MNAVQLASRAVFAAYARRVLRPIEIITVIFVVASISLASYLAIIHSAWWVLLLIPMVIISVAMGILWLLVNTILRKLTPRQTASQKREVRTFVSLIGKHAELLGLTKFGLIIRVIRDIMARNDKNILSSTIDDSKDLAASFKKVIDSFR